VNRPRQDGREAAFRAPWRVLLACRYVYPCLLAAWLLAGCTFNVAPNATDGSLLTVRGGNTDSTVPQPVGSNGIAAVHPGGSDPQSTSDRIVYILFAVATAAYPIWRQIRKWRESRNGNGEKVKP